MLMNGRNSNSEGNLWLEHTVGGDQTMGHKKMLKWDRMRSFCTVTYFPGSFLMTLPFLIKILCDSTKRFCDASLRSNIKKCNALISWWWRLLSALSKRVTATGAVLLAGIPVVLLTFFLLFLTPFLTVSPERQLSSW